MLSGKLIEFELKETNGIVVLVNFDLRQKEFSSEPQHR